MLNKLKKAYISIEIVVIAAVCIIGGLTGTSAFLKNGQNAQSQSAAAMNNTIDMIGEEFGFDLGEANITGSIVTTKEDLMNAIDSAENGDIITVAFGTYDLSGTTLIIDKSIILQGLDEMNKPTFIVTTADGSGSANIISGIDIQANDVTLKNLRIETNSSGENSGNLIQISKNGTEYFSNITIIGCELFGSDHSIALYGNNITIQDCVLDESTAPSQGNILYVWGTSGTLTIRNNTFIGMNQKKHGISFYYQSSASEVSGEIIIEGNRFEDIYKAVVHESSMTYNNVSIKVLNNEFNCKKKAVAIDKGTFVSYTINENVFITTDTSDLVIIDNKVNTVINADKNYWNSNNPEFESVISGSNVEVNNYYSDSLKTNLLNR